MAADFIPLKPIPMKDRVSMIFLQYGQVDVKDGAFVLIDKGGVRTHIPVGSIACIMLEPGTRISHAAIRLAAQVGTLLVWVGEAGVRLYASGQPGGARSDRLLYQAKQPMVIYIHYSRHPTLVGLLLCYAIYLNRSLIFPTETTLI